MHNNALDGQTRYRYVRRQCWTLAVIVKRHPTNLEDT
jgi:hypothetical protein